VRFLTPTENKRLNELVGFLCIIVAVLLAAALISYSPRDAAFNVSRQSSEGGAVRNWIGPVGAYSADLLFQVFGLVIGWRWLRSRAIDSQVATLVGYGLLLLSLPSLLALCHFPEVRGAIPPGGFAGSLISNSLLAGFNFWGALLVAVALFFTSLFMTTSFSFAGTHAWATSPKGPIGAVERLGILQKTQARWHAWREEREQRRMRRRVEESRLSGRKPVPPQTIGRAELLNESQKSIRLADESDIFRNRTGVEEED
jgi:S-DNA-T family DNA segregation ATPase FtsK/SpoIIIE